MGDDWVSVIDVASQHGKRKSTVFKVLKRLGIEPRKSRRSSSQNQLVAYISEGDYRRVVAELATMDARDGEGDDAGGETGEPTSAEEGVFYLIQLEPQLDPGRYKVGFAAAMPDRLRALRCSAPFATVLKTWPCRRLWEKTAIDCASSGCERLHTEVFRAGSLGEVAARCDQFFALMPPVVPAAPVRAPVLPQPVGQYLRR